MNYLWIVVAVLVLFFVFSRTRRRQGRARNQEMIAAPRVHGFQVNAYLHPRMSGACLFDNGIQYGRGFRRKEGPALPHDAECGCEAVAFSYTSTEVFKGVLRDGGKVRSTIPDFPSEEAGHLIERLKVVEAGPPPAALEEYIAQIDLSLFPAKYQNDIKGFLKERHGFLFK